MRHALTLVQPSSVSKPGRVGRAHVRTPRSGGRDLGHADGQRGRDAAGIPARGQIRRHPLFFKARDWKFQITTPNASSLHVYFNFNLEDGPVVVDFPAAVGAGLFGTMLDAWQVPLADVGPEGDDEGNGGKYLLLPPDHAEEIPIGYFPVRSESYTSERLAVDERGALYFFACAPPRVLGAATFYFATAKDPGASR